MKTLKFIKRNVHIKKLPDVSEAEETISHPAS